MFRFLLILIVAFTISCSCETDSVVKLKIQGSSTVNPVVSEAAEILREEKGWEIQVDTQGGSSGGISSVAEDFSDIGMSSKPVSNSDTYKYPEVDFNSFAIGIDGVTLAVSNAVWESGINSLSRFQVKNIYSKKISNWSEVGGNDAPIIFYNKEPGRGTWQVFADWTFDGHKNAPLVSHPEVGSNEEGKNKVSSNKGAITQLSYAWVAGSQEVKALGIKTDNGNIVTPSIDSILDGSYPITRKLYILTNGKPSGAKKEFIDFLLSKRGQKLVEKYGYLPVK